MKTNSAILSLVMTAAMTGVLPALADDSNTKQATLAVGDWYQAPDNQRQHFTQTITLAPGQDKLPLTLTYYNGSDVKPSFRWIRVSSPSLSYITEREFHGKKSVSFAVNPGSLTLGNNQIMVDGAGEQGSAFSWRLTSPTPKVSGVASSAVESGNELTILGQNFSTDAATDYATISGTTLKCTAASRTSLTFKIPDDMKSAKKAEIVVTSAGLNAGKTFVQVKNAAPVLTRMGMQCCPPGGLVKILGGPFVTDARSVRVTIGPFDAKVTDASRDAIEVMIPGDFAGLWGQNQPVHVYLNGRMVKNSLTVNCVPQGPGLVTSGDQ